jgi:putative membrane protein
MMWGYGSFGDAGWGWHFIPMVLWWVILLMVILLMFRWVFGIPRRRYGRHGDNAQRILRERYAKGEINKEQFDRMKTDLDA